MLSLGSARQLATQTIREAQRRYKTHYDRSAQEVHVRVGVWVLVYFPQDESGRNRKLSKPWHGPYRITSREDPTVVCTKVYFPQHGEIRVHQSRICPCPAEFPAGYFWYGSGRNGPGRPPRWVDQLLSAGPTTGQALQEQEPTNQGPSDGRDQSLSPTNTTDLPLSSMTGRCDEQCPSLAQGEQDVRMSSSEGWNEDQSGNEGYTTNETEATNTQGGVEAREHPTLSSDHGSLLEQDLVPPEEGHSMDTHNSRDEHDSEAQLLLQVGPQGGWRCKANPLREEGNTADRRHEPRRMKGDGEKTTTGNQAGASPPLQASQTQEKDGSNEGRLAEGRHPKLGGKGNRPRRDGRLRQAIQPPEQLM